MGIKVEGCASEVGIHSKDDREVGRAGLLQKPLCGVG